MNNKVYTASFSVLITTTRKAYSIDLGTFENRSDATKRIVAEAKRIIFSTMHISDILTPDPAEDNYMTLTSIVCAIQRFERDIHASDSALYRHEYDTLEAIGEIKESAYYPDRKKERDSQDERPDLEKIRKDIEEFGKTLQASDFVYWKYPGVRPDPGLER